jgi:acetylornithine deacetylase/succinyl-diaminopimelate desuccinylase-like protein
MKVRCSLRLAPTHDGNKVVELLRHHFIERQEDDTFGAKISFEVVDTADGFAAPDLPPHIKEIVNTSCTQVFDGRPPIYTGIGGAIPFMGLFAQEFPKASFLLTGICGITCNAHAANENIDLELTRKFTSVMAIILSKI